MAPAVTSGFERLFEHHQGGKSASEWPPKRGRRGAERSQNSSVGDPLYYGFWGIAD